MDYLNKTKDSWIYIFSFLSIANLFILRRTCTKFKEWIHSHPVFLRYGNRVTSMFLTGFYCDEDVMALCKMASEMKDIYPLYRFGKFHAADISCKISYSLGILNDESLMNTLLQKYGSFSIYKFRCGQIEVGIHHRITDIYFMSYVEGFWWAACACKDKNAAIINMKEILAALERFGSSCNATETYMGLLNTLNAKFKSDPLFDEIVCEILTNMIHTTAILTNNHKAYLFQKCLHQGRIKSLSYLIKFYFHVDIQKIEDCFHYLITSIDGRYYGILKTLARSDMEEEFCSAFRKNTFYDSWNKERWHLTKYLLRSMNRKYLRLALLYKKTSPTLLLYAMAYYIRTSYINCKKIDMFYASVIRDCAYRLAFPTPNTHACLNMFQQYNYDQSFSTLKSHLKGVLK